MFEIEEIQGNKVFFNPDSNLVYCKTLIVDCQDLIDADESSYDRYFIKALKSDISIEDSINNQHNTNLNSNVESVDLVVKKTALEVEIGCIKMSTEQSQNLIKKLKTYAKQERRTSEPQIS